MRKNEAIVVTLNEDGTVEIDAVGFKGASCEKATAFLEQALGMNATRKTKPEYYAKETVKQAQHT